MFRFAPSSHAPCSAALLPLVHPTPTDWGWPATGSRPNRESAASAAIGRGRIRQYLADSRPRQNTTLPKRQSLLSVVPAVSGGACGVCLWCLRCLSVVLFRLALRGTCKARCPRCQIKPSCLGGSGRSWHRNGCQSLAVGSLLCRGHFLT